MFGFREHGMRRGKPDAVDERIHRQQLFRFFKRMGERVDQEFCAFADEFAVQRLALWISL
jgi:hypothetical protein